MPRTKPGTYDIQLSMGLEGQDDNLDILSRLFEQLQVATVETADPHLDLITFATSAYYFAVISEYYVPPSPAPESDKEDELEEWARRLKLKEKLAREKAEMDRRLKVLARRKGLNKSLAPSSTSSSPLLSFRPPMPTVVPNRTREPLFPDGEHLDKEISTPLTSAEINSWRSRTHPKGIGSSRLPVHKEPGTYVDDKLLDKQAALWGEFEPKWEEGPSMSTLALLPPRLREKVIGIVYLTSSLHNEDPLHVGELNIGIILDEQARGKGYARRAIEVVTQKAFEDAKCHRLQAILLNHVAKDRALCLFTEMRFHHEGTRRRSFFSPMELEWKDATYMAILDTDWVYNKSRGGPSYMRSAPKSLWDELLTRHQQEREELLNWESRTLKRSSSTATLRAVSPIPTALPITSESETDPEMSDSSSHRLSYLQKGKRKAASSEVEGEHNIIRGYSMLPSESEASTNTLNKKLRSSSPASVSSDSFTDDEESMSQGGYDSVTSWDGLETPLSPSDGDSMSDSDDSSFYDVADDA
ncbi:hypothetical protein BDZ94DRAFT_202162 [Collybia nuda]|uniref:N-acetyltransferase domain-containing protein n=1 Tax=Collybia nuda TaxID=64659 RepID=A0A9P5XXT9_9AGAR|nr:hypothetical protein BDZ94DRAFT_202162 [Collybia nuda]